MIVIDWDLEKLDRQPDNVIALTKFSGDINDRELIDLLPFLERIISCSHQPADLASPGVTDVRKEILKYRSEEGGYKKFMEDLMESKKKLVQQKVCFPHE